MNMTKRQGLVAFLAAALSAGLPSIGYAATYSLDIGSSGNELPSPVGTVQITGGGNILTYEFFVPSGTLSYVYMDVTGSGVTESDSYGTGNSGATTTALGTFADTVHVPLLYESGTEFTFTFTGTGLAAGYTLLDGDIEMFSAAMISNSVVGDTPTTPLPATLPLFAAGIGALGLLMRRSKLQKPVL
jgi:hypothetical protein